MEAKRMIIRAKQCKHKRMKFRIQMIMKVRDWNGCHRLDAMIQED